ncbi:MAG TPA: hypothetical protein VNB64_04780, partial [Solirubrobacteraceae bacterium]|nr:hypothetical protein [Solirubrobacteraceae bacterium]
MPRRPCVALLAALGATLALSGPASAAPRVIPWGLTDATSPERLDRSRELGATVGRYFVCWCDLEPEPGRFDFGFVDRINADFAARGMRPLPAVVGTPTWARAECASLPRPCLYPPDEVHLPRWRELFRRLAVRYPRLKGIEVWNEPNLAHFWKPRVDAARYVRLLRAAHAGAKAGNRRLPVVAGSMCLCGGGEGGADDSVFLHRMYATGARGAFDAIGVHPYPTDLPVIANARDKMSSMRRVRARWRDRSPFWVTEAGISSAPGGTGGHPRLSEPLQARALAVLARTFRQMRDVDVAILFRYRDITDGFTTWENGLGIVERADGTPKPAGAAVAAAFRVRAPYRRPRPVRLVVSARRVEVGRRVLLRAVGYPRRVPPGGRLFAWDVAGTGFNAYTGARPTRSRVWRAPGRYRVGVRAGDRLDAGEG